MSPIGVLYRLDTDTHRETPLPDLTERVRSYPTTTEFQISPDGRWLLWEHARYHAEKTGRRSDTYTVQAATLEGKQFVSRPLGSYIRYLRRTPPQQMHRLIVCELDGRHCHTIGAPIASCGDPYEIFGDLQWSPNGRRLSYVCDGQLTIVPNG